MSLLLAECIRSSAATERRGGIGKRRPVVQSMNVYNPLLLTAPREKKSTAVLELKEEGLLLRARGWSTSQNMGCRKGRYRNRKALVTDFGGSFSAGSEPTFARKCVHVNITCKSAAANFEIHKIYAHLHRFKHECFVNFDNFFEKCWPKVNLSEITQAREP